LSGLQAMKATLEHLVQCCHGDDRPDCPIIDSLASGTAVRGDVMHTHKGDLRSSKH
jgi:hypothetical protein